MSICCTGYCEFTAVTIDTQVHAKSCDIGKNAIGHGYFRKKIFSLLDFFLKLKLFAIVLFHKSIGIIIEFTATFNNVDSFSDIENGDDSGMQTKTIKKLRTQLPFFGVAGSYKHKARRVTDTDTFTFNNVFATCCNVEQNVNKMVVKQVNFVDIEEPAVSLSKKTWFKGLNTTGKSLFDIDGSANTIFGCTKGKVNNRNRNFFSPYCKRINSFCAFFAFFIFEILLDSSVIGVALDPFDQRKHFSKCPDRCTFSCTSVTHDKNSTDPWVNDIEDQTELHFFLTDNCSKRKRQA